MRAAMFACAVLAAACGGKTADSGGGARPSVTRADGLAGWATMQSVFQHPRCQNCHPSTDTPLQGDDSHVHQQNVQRGPDGRGRIGEQCTTCHLAANPPDSYGLHTPPGVSTGWRMPKPEEKLVFVGMSPKALCEQTRDPAKNGGKDMAALRHHFDDPLVTWGWSPGLGRAPVSVPRDQFLHAFETWAAAGAPCPE